MNPTKIAYIKLHIAVIFFGISAILGAKITLAALELVWWRVLITSVSLFFLIGFGRKLSQIPKKRIIQFMLIGVLIALHWICFFGAIKLANASITLVCYATAAFFTALAEPLIMGSKMKWYEIVLGLIMVPGMVLVVNSTDVSMHMGIILGVLSAIFGALFGTFNKKIVQEADSLSITFLELVSAWLFISLLLPIFFDSESSSFWPNNTDWYYLLALSLLCTTFAFVISLQALEHISAFASSLVFNLEPVYGILLAIPFLGENKDLNGRFYIGVAIILSSIFIYPLIKRKLDKST